MTLNDRISLTDWRWTVAKLYAAVRRAEASDAARACHTSRAARNELLKTHPQSPLDALSRPALAGLNHDPYDPAWRIAATMDMHVERVTSTVDLSGDGLLRYTCIARLHFACQGEPAHLNVYWIEGYGGGLFVPFLDATTATETYGGGRYLYDTVKGADLGWRGDSLVLDFNYAYNPSCAYDDRWQRPLAPAENRLPFPVRAGEKSFVQHPKVQA
jgi:uncharacterized protein